MPSILTAVREALASNKKDPQTDVEYLLEHIQHWQRPSLVNQPALGSSFTALRERPPVYERWNESVQPSIGLLDDPDHQEQRSAFMDFSSGAIFIEGGSGSGRTCALRVFADAFLVAPIPAQIVVIDGGGGDLGRSLDGGADWIIDGSDKGNLTLLLAQLLEGERPKAENILVLIDRLDQVQATLTDYSSLVLLLTQGARYGVSVVCTFDPRIPLEAVLRRTIRQHFVMLNGHPGAMEDYAHDGVMIALYAAADSVQAQPRKPTHRHRPLGRPDARRVRVDARSEQGITMGVSLISHQPVHLQLQTGLAIAGKRGSGRTTALLTIAKRMAERYGVRAAILSPAAPPGDLPWWYRNFSLDIPGLIRLEDGKPETVEKTASNIIEAVERSGLPVLFVDDLDQLATVFSNLGIPERVRVGVPLNKALMENRIRIIASGPASMFYAQNPSPLIGERQLSPRQQMLNLMPLSPHLYENAERTISGIGRMYMNFDDRDYRPGEGSYANFGSRDDIKIMGDPEVEAMLRRGPVNHGWL